MLDQQEIKDALQNDSSEKNYEKQDSFSQNLEEIENKENEQEKQKSSESNVEEIKALQLKMRDLELIRKMKKLVSQIDEHIIEIEEINESQKNKQKQMKKHVLSSQIMARFAGERRHNLNLKQDLAGITISKDFLEIFRGKSKKMSPEEEEQTLQQFLIQHNFQSPKWKKYLELIQIQYN
ncbi:hypothetical protein PPERSA_00381 [Pseudocohnilembus persalinus]|uniref:Uncharacterized protein n=1 Tax=Pseudocohnilembus persalinus TaxID=266149 RepID=A0A0V0QZA0_PSEPJ|nr:hypothetical protein PPERSA_00381 [Pseudocohnilembus persalinus]|eukprot:KRX07224.1 hypothetical protein PPERSA_00381 [Pseudocohnilembus persalinus]